MHRVDPPGPEAPKKGSKDDWTDPQDPDAKITKTKDDRTRLAHKTEHPLGLESAAVVAVTVQDADDTTTVDTPITAAEAVEAVEAVLPAAEGLLKIVGDKGYDSNATVVALAKLRLRSYVSEPDRRRPLRQRDERLERPNVHLYETGRLRRVHLRGHANILKRLPVHASGLNLGLLMRQVTGVGTPRSLRGRVCGLRRPARQPLLALCAVLLNNQLVQSSLHRPLGTGYQAVFLTLQPGTSSTGCYARSLPAGTPSASSTKSRTSPMAPTRHRSAA